MVKIVQDCSDDENDKPKFYTNLYEKTIEPIIFGFFLGIGLSSGFYLGTLIYSPTIRLLPNIRLS